MQDATQAAQRVILVTGPAGAGRSTAINALEDLGYEVVDNLPIALVPRLIDGADTSRPLAFGLDTRNRQFTPDGLISLHAQLIAQDGLQTELVYLDCSREVLLRRFSETRRRHPLAPEGATTDGIDRELSMLATVKQVADVLLDTSDLSPHDLRAQIQGLFAATQPAHLAIALTSFSYKRGLPLGVDLVLDCRFLDNPYWQPDLRALTGQSARVKDHIARDARFAPFLTHVTDLIAFLLPAFRDEGKAHISIAFGCTGGQHRSVAVTEVVSQSLAQAGWQVSTKHRELERRGLLNSGLQAGTSGMDQA